MAKRRPISSLPMLTADAEHLVRDLEVESDRGAALLGAAFLDDVLDVILRACFVDDPAAADRMLGPGRPIESFGARTHLSYVLGLIGPDVYADINQIREIRNEFAHRQPATFDEPQIVERCNQLRAVRALLPDRACTPRERFVATVVLLVHHLTAHAARITHAQPGLTFSDQGILRLK